MKNLKFTTYGSRELLIKFANDNKIAKDDIVIITYDSVGGMYTLFYYGES